MTLTLPLPWSLRLLHVIALVVPILRLLRRWSAPWRLLLWLLWLLCISGLRVIVVAIVPALLVMSVLVVTVLIVAIIVVLLVVVVIVASVLLLALRRIPLVVVLLLLLLRLLRSPGVVLLLVCHGGAGRYRLFTRFGRVYQVVLRIAPPQLREAACFKPELGRNRP